MYAVIFSATIYQLDNDYEQRAEKLKELAFKNKNIMEASIECAHAGVTTGEWTDTLRKIYGEYRAPTGVGKTPGMEKKSLKN